MADSAHASLVRQMGFDWAKGYVSWATTEPRPGDYDWSEVDKIIQRASAHDLKLLLRVDRAPGWSHPSTEEPGAPPDPQFLADWGRFLQTLAQRARGAVQAYEIWNEPNLAVEWGTRRPEPARYVELLRIAYWAIKAADPSAIVVSAGLAPTTTNDETAFDNVLYLDAMYKAGAASYFDVLGSHPHAGAQGAESEAFRRTELERAIMGSHDDAHKFSWATEMAWLTQPPTDCRSDPRWSTKLPEVVSPVEQAERLADAFRFVRANWPWMNAIFVFNLDFMAAGWYDPCEPMRYEGLLEADASPRPAFEALARMDKPGLSAGSPWPSALVRLVPALRGQDGLIARASRGEAFPRGPLLKDPCNTIWVIAEGRRRAIPDVQTFGKAGYSWDEVVDSDWQGLARYPQGFPLPSVKEGPHPDKVLARVKGADQVFELRGFASRRPVTDYGSLQRTDPCIALKVLEIPSSALDELPLSS